MSNLSVKDYRVAIDQQTCYNAKALRIVFESLNSVKVDLPPGEVAYWTLPRVSDEWRMSEEGSNQHESDQIRMLPVRGEHYVNNAYLAVIPQPIVLNRKVSAVLENYAQRLLQHFPVENSLAQREYGVPMLIGRFDVIVDRQGGVQMCELDDVCSLWPALPTINPIANSYLRALESQLGMPIYTAELFQYHDGAYAISPLARQAFSRISYSNDAGEPEDAYVRRSQPLELGVVGLNGLEWRKSYKESERNAEYFEGIISRAYLHNEDHWNGEINDAWLMKQESRKLDEVALSIRAFRDMPGFRDHIDRYGPRSITMAWERDSKWSLVAEKLGALAANLDVAVEFGKQWQLDHPDDLLVFKTLYGARTEGTAIYSSRGTKSKGVSSATQIAKKFGSSSNGPIVVQPFKEPDTLAGANVHFIGTEDEQNGTTYTDRKLLRSVAHIGSETPGERVIAGMEDHFSMIFRSFVIYLPEEKRLMHVGGMWQATDGRIVHGGAHSIAGPLYIDGFMGHPKAKRNADLDNAERILKLHSQQPSAGVV